MTAYDYDLFVIGAGSGGVRAARMSAQFGARVGIAEERYLGGTCVNVGCVPKKLFVYSAHYAEDFADAQAYGWDLQPEPVDWPRLRDNKSKEVQRLNEIYRSLLINAGVELLESRARVVDAHTIAVAGRRVSAEKILLATGGWPFVPHFHGAEHVITSNEAFHLSALPKRPLVVGGGYISVEFAGIFNGLGCETRLIYRGPKLLRRFDKDVSRVVTEELSEKGIDLLLNHEIFRIEKTGSQQYEVELDDGSRLQTDCILYATGRKPLLDDLGLENVEVDIHQNGKVVVNDKFQTTEPSIFAVGDIIDSPELTPVALAEGMALARTQFGGQPEVVDYNNIATAVFCQPNVGTVGLTEQQAREDYDVEIYTSRFRTLKHSLTENKEKTFMKLVVDKASDKVLGVHMVGPESGEILQGIAIALKAGATKQVFDRTIGIHPTIAEEFVSMREPTAV